MAAIKTMEVTIKTGNNGTMGAVYLGIAGREFRLNRYPQNDFMRNSISQFMLGDDSHAFAVKNPDGNDPKQPMPLDTNDIARYPLYLRLAGANGHWEIVEGSIRVEAGAASKTIRILPQGVTLLMGPDTGEFLHIEQP
jgi:hypothetical protein